MFSEECYVSTEVPLGQVIPSNFFRMLDTLKFMYKLSIYFWPHSLLVTLNYNSQRA
jgi:hypothetical protein